MGGKQSSYYSPPSVIGAGKKNKTKRIHKIEDLDSEYDFEPVERLTMKEKEVIKRTWQQIETNAEKVGASTFSNLFRMHPSVRDEFVVFKSIDVKDEKYNLVLQEHGVRVLSTIGKMVRRLDDSEDTIPSMLRELGTRHGAIYNAKSSLIGIIGPHFLKSIEHCLGKDWSAEVESAYAHMFDILAFHMKQALTRASMNLKVGH